ncbi:transposase [Acetobacter sicerae]|uniref:Transposase n=1 Tax=Acetobacter sicerae TaxID=85325 RepID=A0ABS8VZH7_9PROT|nr:transposase [Acetobacter sicerae]MCE0745224.1 transposase [Acetobacter sicerae]
MSLFINILQGSKKREADQGFGWINGELTTKIHVIVDVAGKILVFFVILEQRDDITGAELLLDEGDPETFIADEAYDADPFIKKIEDRRFASVATYRKR